jgi:hypothetical protein
MKKFLAIALLLVMVASVFVVASTAAETPTYWAISPDCLVKTKLLDDGTVPTFKKVGTNNAGYDGLLVGLPTYATVGDEFFEAKDGYYYICYDNNGQELYYSDDHLGTTDKVVVYNEDNEIAATYGIVTYGDADGDGVFDVIDSSLAALCLSGIKDAIDEPAIYESVKPRTGVDNELVEAEDYQQVVNDSVKDEWDLEDNLKGRKIPVDTTIDFESAIYAYDGKAKCAVAFADANFKKLTTVTYNGSATVPTTAGIYAVDATVKNDEAYLVNPGTINLGFVVIAPQANTGYKVTADNANKKIIIGTTDNDTSNATLAAAFEKWLNSSYSLNIGGTVNPSTVASVLPNRNFEVYSGQTSTLVKNPKSDVLGSYLPDDETLWSNNIAANTKKVNLTNGTASFSFDLSFQQDEATVEAAKRTYFMDCSAAARGQRTDWTTDKGVVKEDKKDVNLFVKMKNGFPAARVAIKSNTATCATALNGTGLKGVLVGRADSVAIQASPSPDFTGKDVISLFETSGYRYSNYALSSYSDAKKVLPVMNAVLGGMGTSLPNNVAILAITSVSSFANETGYCNYRCSGLNSSIRYNIVFYLEFMNFAGSGEDANRTITTNTPANGTITVKPANRLIHTKVYEHTIMNAGEPVIVTATPNSGYKLKSLTVTKADGTQVSVDADGYFLMPESDITINAEFEAK